MLFNFYRSILVNKTLDVHIATAHSDQYRIALFDAALEPVHPFPVVPGQIDSAAFADTKPGDNIVFAAEMDIVVAISPCPQDITRICGGKITDVLVEIGS